MNDDTALIVLKAMLLPLVDHGNCLTCLLLDVMPKIYND